ncbi:hypothetical protein D3C87_1874980 [compost metagenome]
MQQLCLTQLNLLLLTMGLLERLPTARLAKEIEKLTKWILEMVMKHYAKLCWTKVRVLMY